MPAGARQLARVLRERTSARAEEGDEGPQQALIYGHLEHRLEGVERGDRLAVSATGRHGVEDIRDPRDLAEEVDIRAFEAPGITRAVLSLLVLGGIGVHARRTP